MQNYDVVIIGGGPAGLSAGIYAARGCLKTLVIEQAILGGQIVLTNEVENYPGFPEVLSGFQLGQFFELQAHKHGVEIRQAIVTELDFDSKTIKLGNDTIQARFIVIATGAQSRKLGIPGESEFQGRGVSYCATCDGAFFKGKQLAVIGGGDSAVEEAIYLSKIASKVTVIHRRAQLRAAKIIQERAFGNPKIDFMLSYTPVEIRGTRTVEQLVLQNTISQDQIEKSVDGVFVYIGQIPNTHFLQNQLKLDELNFVITNDKMETSVPGIYAVGDVRNTVLRQVVTAAADGAIAATEITKLA